MIGEPPPGPEPPSSGETTPKPTGRAAIPIPSQTPLYHALHQARYTRQERIRAIEERTGRRLICFVAGPDTSISGWDIPPFVDLLEDVDQDHDLDLLLHTPGGDVDQAERIVLLCRKAVGNAQFRVVVTDGAKSAGTLIAIAADWIVMGDPSELGPIDPQVFITTKDGESMVRPAQSYLDGLDSIKEEVEKNNGKLSPVYFPLLDKLDPALIDFCKKARQRSQEFAEKFLKQYMLKENPEKAVEVATELNDVHRYISHGAVIDADRALEIGLKVEKLSRQNDLWQAYWRLYCDLRTAIERPNERIFESRRASIIY
jgi:hypothetical protein